MQIIPFILYLMAMTTNMEEKKVPLTYLALGDSYTIGESVPIYESFPYQTVQLLRSKGMEVNAPEIIAKTGWTTDELQAGINKSMLHDKYDIVSLLIGVNNQYRGRTVEEYRNEFEALLKKAIQFAGNKKKHVFVISIPDWGATPFAENRDRKKIGIEIDQFNEANKKISELHGIQYIEITAESRDVINNPLLAAKDKLHPSGLEYKKWAMKLADAINKNFYR